MLPMNLCTAHSFSHLFSVSTFLSRNKIYRDITQNIFCLQVIANSISLLNPSDVLKLLHSLQSIIHSRWTIICLIKICLVNLTDHVCVICPWFFFFKFVPNSNNYFFWIIIVCGFSLTRFILRILERQKQKYYLNSTQTYLSMRSYEMWFCYRGSILACALPWLRSLLLQHSTGIMSQESSLLALNSLYQVKNENLTLERLWRVMYSNKKVLFILKFMSEYALWTFLLSFWPFPGYFVFWNIVETIR